MDFNYTEEQLLVQKTAREFAQEHLAPGAIDRDEKMEFPSVQIKMLGEMGFMGMMVSEEWGGAGFDTVSYSLALEEIARADAAAAVPVSVNNSLACTLLHKFGSQEQKERYLRKLTAGDWLGAFALSEPQAGSDASNLLTFAEKNGTHYFVNGTKNWVSNGINCNIVFALVLTEKGAGYHGITVLAIEKDSDGFTSGKKENKLGVRASDTCEIYFDDCRVPVENRVGNEGAGFGIAMSVLDGGRIGIASQAVGIAQAALEKSVVYANEREQFGSKLSSFGAIKEKIANMATEISAARLLTHQAASLKDEGKPFTKAAAMAKYYASEVAMSAATECVQIFGGYGYMREYGVERLMRDAKITQIYEGTSEIQKLVIARSLLEEA